MELTDKIRRVYLPMTETGFYILFCLQKENHGYGITQKGQRDDKFAGFNQSWNYVWNLVKNGKGWFDFLCPRRGKTENLSDNRLGTKKSQIIELKRIERLYRNSREEG